MDVRNKEAAKLLIENGADLGLQTEKGETALMYAIKRGFTDIAKKLIDKGANLDLEDNDGITALEWALKLNKPKIESMIKKAKIKK